MANLTGSTICLVRASRRRSRRRRSSTGSSRRAHAEALAVAAAHGVVLDDSPDVRYGPKRVYFSHRPSILQDYDLGRPMEIEAIVRAPVAFARSAGVADADTGCHRDVRRQHGHIERSLRAVVSSLGPRHSVALMITR